MSVYTYLKRAFKRKDVVRCLRCDRVLTNEKSINRGYGRKCFRIINLGENMHEKHKDTYMSTHTHSPNNDELLDRIRKLELDNNFIKHQLKHKVYVSSKAKSEDALLDWDLKPEVKEARDETKIQFTVIIKELKVKFEINPGDTFDYHNILKPINARETIEDPPNIIESLELITN